MPLNELAPIHHSLLLNAGIQKVWDAVATPEGIAAWFMPNNFAPVVGHDFYLDAGPYGKAPCKVLAVEPPTRLSFQWTDAWVVTFELADVGGKTQFTLTHSGWSAEGTTAFGEPHALVRDRMDGGWSGLVRKLQALVEG